jgi:hypothetical protein
MLYEERQAYSITMFVCLPAAVNNETWCECHYIGGHPSFKTVNYLLSVILTRCADMMMMMMMMMISSSILVPWNFVWSQIIEKQVTFD